jgi:hypothetical protein
MTERPILFSAEMVRAILEGSKTQARRKMKPAKAKRPKRWLIDDAAVNGLVCPYGAPGDLLWVREAWRAWSQYDDWPPSRLPPGVDVQYIADAGAPWASRYRSPRFMPRWASRLTLEVKSVHVERLQDISEDDARAEGCEPVGWIDETDVGMSSYREGFTRLWNRINGAGAWEANPWVWVIEFERVKP